MDTKKGKGTPYTLEAPLPVIVSLWASILLALYRKRARLTLCQSEQLLPCFLLSLSIVSSLLPIARNPLALSLED